jgi:hypothetical protein
VTKLDKIKDKNQEKWHTIPIDRLVTHPAEVKRQKVSTLAQNTLFSVSVISMQVYNNNDIVSSSNVTFL